MSIVQFQQNAFFQIDITWNEDSIACSLKAAGETHFFINEKHRESKTEFKINAKLQLDQKNVRFEK